MMNRKSRTASISVLLVMLSSCSDSGSQTSNNAGEAANDAPQSSATSIAEMTAAELIGNKVGAPVDVRYTLADNVAVKDQPMTVEIAVIPRVEGTNLQVAFLESESLSVNGGAADMTISKATASEVYRQRVIVTPKRDGGDQLRVMVTMDVANGRYTSIFAVPTDGGSSAKASNE